MKPGIHNRKALPVLWKDAQVIEPFCKSIKLNFQGNGFDYNHEFLLEKFFFVW